MPFSRNAEQQGHCSLTISPKAGCKRTHPHRASAGRIGSREGDSARAQRLAMSEPQTDSSQNGAGPELELTPGIIVALGHPTRLKILREYHRTPGRQLPAKEIGEILGIGLNLASYHVRVLAGDESENALREDHREQKRGASQAFYVSQLQDVPLVEAYISKYADTLKIPSRSKGKGKRKRKRKKAVRAS